jgi:O-antigen/teichoic acid export membrane protein
MLVLVSLGNVPRGLLEKELRFRELSLVDGAGGGSAALSVLALAWWGWGYWALVAGPLAGAAVTTGAVLLVRPHSFGIPRGIRPALKLSYEILRARLAFYVFTQADTLILAKTGGHEELGLYVLGAALSLTPVNQLTSILTNVTRGFLAKSKDDRRSLQNYFIVLSTSLLLITVPATVGLALVAEEFVGAVLKDAWSGAAPALQILGIAAVFRGINVLLGHLLFVTGHYKLHSVVNVVTAVVMPLTFLLASRWGAVGMAVVWLTVFPAMQIPRFRRVFRILELTPAAYLRAIKPAFTAAALMAFTVLLVKSATPLIPPTARLVAEVAAGAVGYLGALVLFHRREILELVRELKTLR